MNHLCPFVNELDGSFEQSKVEVLLRVLFLALRRRMGFEVRVIDSLFYVVSPLWALLGMRTCLESKSDGVYRGCIG